MVKAKRKTSRKRGIDDTKKTICSFMVVVLCLCSLCINFSYASVSTSYGETTKSGYSYTITEEKDKPRYWVISTPDETRPTYEYSTIDPRDLGSLLANYEDAVDELKNAEEEYEDKVKATVLKIIPLTIASSALAAKYAAAKTLAVLLPGFTLEDVEDAKDLYDDIIDAREKCEKHFDRITYTISR